MDRLRIAVAGLGNMGQVHAGNVAKLPNARLHAVASRRPEVAQEVAGRFNAERFYADYDQLFSDPDLDAAVIATGIVDHPEQIIQAAQNGLHIFTEKPIAFNLEDTDRVLGAVAEAGVHLQVGFMRRFDPGYAGAKKKIEEGAIGRPVLFKACSRDFDLARWLLGSEVSDVYALGKVLVYPKLAEFGDVDNAVVSLTFENGALGVVDLSRNARYGYDIRTEVLGDEGALSIGGLQQTPLLVLSRDGVAHDVFPWYPERFADAFFGEVAAFVDAVQGGRTPKPGGLDGRRATEVGVAALESWRSKQPVKVERKT
jgi:predicted dehydrogenase